MTTNKTLCILSLLFIVLGNDIDAQSFKPIYIDYNIGVVRRSSDNINRKSNLRETSAWNDWDEYYCLFDYYDAHVKQYYFEVKPEFSLTYKLAFDIGLRYTHSRGEINDDTDLIWKVDEEGVNTYYATADRIAQYTNYIGIPIGLRLAFRDLDRVSPFIKFNTALNFVVGSHNHVRMENKTMNKYRGSIKQSMGRPDTFAIPFYFSAGVQCGPEGMVNIEFMFPYFMRYANAFSMCKLTDSGVGLSVGLRLSRINDLY